MDAPNIPDSGSTPSDVPATTPGTPGAPGPKAGQPAHLAPKADTIRDPQGRFQAGSEKPAPDAQTEAQKAAERRKYRLKVDGQEREEELSDEEIAVRLQKGYAADKRMAEAAEIRKANKELRELAKKDRRALLKELGGIEDVDAWIEQEYAQRIKKELMPEPERKQLEIQQRAEAAERRAAELEARIQAEAQSRQDAVLAQQIEETYTQAFKVAGLDWSPENVEAMGRKHLEYLEMGVDLTPQQLAAEVKADITGRERGLEEKYRAKLASLDGAQLLEFLGQDVLKKALRASVDKFKAPPPALNQAEPVQQKPSDDADKPRRRIITEAEWRKQFRHTRTGTNGEK
jgi:hypothetical protein